MEIEDAMVWKRNPFVRSSISSLEVVVESDDGNSHTVTHNSPTHRISTSSTMTEHKDDAVETALDKLKPFFAKMTFGSLVGYCSGYAMKKVGKAAAVCVGMGFMIFQGAAYTGYIDVNWSKVKESAKNKADVVRT